MHGNQSAELAACVCSALPGFPMLLAGLAAQGARLRCQHLRLLSALTTKSSWLRFLWSLHSLCFPLVHLHASVIPSDISTPWASLALMLSTPFL